MKKKIKNFTLLMAIAVFILFLINKLINIFANMKEHLPRGNGKFFTWRYGDIYYIKKGKGKPILLIHDMDPSSSAYEWHKIIHQLSKTNTVYAIDLLGCGRSDKPNLTYTNYLYVELITDFIHEIIGEKTDVITTGASLSFVVMACQLEQKIFNKIIGVSPADLYELAKSPTKHNIIIKAMIEFPIIGTLIYNILMSKNALLRIMMDEYYYKEYLVSNQMLNSYHHSAHMQNGQGKYLLASINSHYTNINIVPALKKINHSICLIGGKEHPFMSDIIDDYISFNPAIESAYIANTKYLPQLESPEKFVELLNIVLQS